MHGIMVSPMLVWLYVSDHQTLDQPMVGWYVGSLDLVLEEQLSGSLAMMFFFIRWPISWGGGQPVDSRAAL